MRKLRILLVDDDGMIAGLLTEILEALGHTVCSVARTEDEAVGAAAHHEPDLIIIDMMLDEGDGTRAMERVLRSRHIPHVYMTGSVLPTGAIALQKPFREAELQTAMARAMATAH